MLAYAECGGLRSGGARYGSNVIGHLVAPHPLVPVCVLQLYREAAECMNLLSQRLGSHKFFFGES